MNLLNVVTVILYQSMYSTADFSTLDQAGCKGLHPYHCVLLLWFLLTQSVVSTAVSHDNDIVRTACCLSNPQHAHSEVT